MFKRITYIALGAVLSVGALLGLPLLAAAPSQSQACGPSNVDKQCGTADSLSGWVIGDEFSGQFLDMFYMQDGTEYFAIEDDGSDVKLSSASGAVEIQDFASVCNGTCPTGASATGAGDLLVEDALEVDGATDLDGTLNVAGVTTLSAGVDLATPAAALESIRFCGTGGATATTAHFIGPVLLDDTEADLAFGGAGCDALDNATEATADAPWHAAFDIKPVAMACSTTGGGGLDDVVTFQMREDTSDVTGLTCNVTLSGTTPQTCAVRLTSPETVAAASTVAVSITAATDDDVSAVDFECIVYVTF